jgi:bacteriorhodopsin
MTEALVVNTTYTSLWIQGLTGMIVLYGILFVPNLSEQHKVLHTLLYIEACVQIIQFTFYFSSFKNFHLPSMASARYIDWIITTPLLLFTLMVYFKYESTKEDAVVTVKGFISEYKNTVFFVLLCNFIMLTAGYFGEKGIMNRYISTTIGFIAFYGVFVTIYKEFVRETNHPLFFIVFAVWSVYGIAYLFPDNVKNITFNVLDLFAKNLFGVYLVYKIISLA